MPVNELKKRQPIIGLSFLYRRLLIFPGGCPPSIVSTSELNFRVRNGNGWNLTVISTDLAKGNAYLGLEDSWESPVRDTENPKASQATTA